MKEWELQDARGAADGDATGKVIEDHHSLPQMTSAGAIDAHLKRWWAQSTR